MASGAVAGLRDAVAALRKAAEACPVVPAATSARMDIAVERAARAREAAAAAAAHAVGAGHAWPSGMLSFGTEDEAASVVAVDAIDSILQRCDVLLDSARGIATGAPALFAATRAAPPRPSGRPQDRFATKVDNSRAPFVPRIASKPSGAPIPRALPDMTYPHPFEAELNALSYAGWMVARESSPAPFPQEDGVRFVMVDTHAALTSMVAAISSSRIIALDVEHHSEHSFLGLTCLVQVSTLDTDYLVDALALRDYGHVLNIVTANPSIVKVLHGCDHDVKWLQRDMGIYLVNVFDTHLAARTLELPRASLATVLEHYAGVKADKQWQLADWRVRPLPTAMVSYARADTRYLIGVYGRMKNELLEEKDERNERNPLLAVLDASRDLCLQRYEKPVFTTDAYCSLLALLRHRVCPPASAPGAGAMVLAAGVVPSDAERERVFADVYDWRDRTARALDEAPDFVLPRNALATIARECPTSVAMLTRVCTPLPRAVAAAAQDVVGIIARARADASRVLPAIPVLVQLLKAVRHEDTVPRPISARRHGVPAYPIGALRGPPNVDELCDMAGWVALPDGQMPPIARAGAAGGLFMTGHAVAMELDDDVGTAAEACARVAAGMREPIMGPVWTPATPAPAPPVPAAPGVPAFPSAAPVVVLAGVVARGPGSGADTDIPQTYKEIFAVSNLSRKQNKEKKKAAGPEGHRRTDSGGGAAQPMDANSAIAFMQKIGWIDPSSRGALEATAAAAAEASSTRAEGGGGGSSGGAWRGVRGGEGSDDEPRGHMRGGSDATDSSYTRGGEGGAGGRGGFEYSHALAAATGAVGGGGGARWRGGGGAGRERGGHRGGR